MCMYTVQCIGLQKSLTDYKQGKATSQGVRKLQSQSGFESWWIICIALGISMNSKNPIFFRVKLYNL